ncbi:MAG: hypothetical protein ABI480_10045 [Chitinophagaceae bacterium]
MEYEVYSDLKARSDYQIFEFKSIGKNGNILKGIMFMPTKVQMVYNLEFGDIDKNGKLNYYSISNNDDRDKILATIVKAIDIYTIKYPDRLIYFSGSTKERTRLYRMAISVNFEKLSEKFEIMVKTENELDFTPFKKNIQAKGFLIKRK